MQDEGRYQKAVEEGQELQNMGEGRTPSPEERPAASPEVEEERPDCFNRLGRIYCSPYIKMQDERPESGETCTRSMSVTLTIAAPPVGTMAFWIAKGGSLIHESLGNLGEGVEGTIGMFLFFSSMLGAGYLGQMAGRGVNLLFNKWPGSQPEAATRLVESDAQPNITYV